jgi:4-hydroxy-3-methylbut-2-enyl diphosphate reductase
MEIILSKFSGYCYGVKKAVSVADESIDKYEDIYSLGSLIHNKRAVEKLKNKGLKVVDDIEEKNKNIIFRSHGVEKKYYDYANKNNLNVIDTTCIYVKKIHQIVEEKYKDGYEIIIVGSKKHPEVIGINSWSNYKAQFVEDISDTDKLNIDEEKSYAVVFQTTFNIEKYTKIVEILKEKIKNVEIFNTICSATKKRQDFALQLADEVDMMIVIGDTSSSNSKKLYELANEKVKSIFIEDVAELEEVMFEGVQKLGVTAGASTPDFVIDEVIEYLKKIN